MREPDAPEQAVRAGHGTGGFGVGVLLERLLTRSAELVVLVPDEEGRNDALELFLTRSAAAGRPVTVEEEPRIEALCRNLDGMALGIELAAARMPSLGLDGLEAGLADRLQLLTGGRRNNQRHQSLRSTLDWSYALLHEPERTVLRRISVFAASFSPEAAEPNRSPNGLPQNSARCGRSSEPLPITAS